METLQRTDTGLRAVLQAMPKVDLHRHLEGSLRLQTLREIAQEHRLELSDYDPEHLRPLVTVGGRELDFTRFLDIFAVLRRFYLSRETVERLAYEAVADAGANNVRYLELRFNPAALAQARGYDLYDVTTWVCEAVQRAQRDCNVTTSLIVQLGRAEPLRNAQEVAEVALAHRNSGIVALDLAGDEIRFPARIFASIFQRVREEGLSVTVHAGEAGGPANVREAIELLHAQRIGHGVRVVEDEDVVRLARERDVAFEVCPTSNMYTGVAGRRSPHPFPQMVELGLRVTLNTDDPGITDTTLTDEYLAVVADMGVPLRQLKRTIVAAAESAFQPPEARARLVASLRQALGLA